MEKEPEIAGRRGRMQEEKVKRIFLGLFQEQSKKQICCKGFKLCILLQEGQEADSAVFFWKNSEIGIPKISYQL